MKVRTLERDLYNFIQKRTVVTSLDIIAKFGSGPEGMYSLFIPDAVTAHGLTTETRDALEELRNKGSIFEIACGVKFHILSGGGELTDAPIARFKHVGTNATEYHKYGYSGDYWLPSVFCSDKGLMKLMKSLVKEEKDANQEGYNRLLTDYNQTLRSGTPDERIKLMAWVSYILTEMHPQGWNKAVDRIEKKLINYSQIQKMILTAKNIREEEKKKSQIFLDRSTVVDPNVMGKEEVPLLNASDLLRLK